MGFEFCFALIRENLVQAIARDCLAEALLRLDRAGYKTVMHIHDEAVLEVSDDHYDIEMAQDGFESNLDHVNYVMGMPISWAPGLPLRGDGFTTPFYKKDD